MPRYICHENGRFNIYSDETKTFDYPFGQSESELSFEIEAELGSVGLSQLPPRISRALAKGTSSFNEDETLEALVFGNQAGPNKTSISLPEILEKYFS